MFKHARGAIKKAKQLGASTTELHQKIKDASDDIMATGCLAT